MNISLALHDPLRLRSHGPRPLGHLCRHFVSMGSGAVESLDSACEQPQLWWKRLGPDFSIDTSPPDNHLLSSDKIKLFDVSQGGGDCIKLPLSDGFPAEQRLLAQVNPSFSQAQFSDHTESSQEHSTRRNGGQVLEGRIDHSHVPTDVDFVSSDGESRPHSLIPMSECLCESNHASEDAPEALGSARVKLLCSYGGRIIPRPVDGKLRYAGGETHIMAVNIRISFIEFMSKVSQFYGAPLGFKYQLPDEDLDALVSVSSDDDLQNMMEEYDKVVSSGSASRLRLFFFSTPAEVEVSETRMDGEDGSLVPDQRYVDAINGVSGKLHLNLVEDDTIKSRQVDGGRTVEGSGRTPSFERVNDMFQLKRPTSPSSRPSSPPLASRQASYHKPPGPVDFSLSEHLNRSTMVLKGFEGDVELEGLATSVNTPFHHRSDLIQYDQQFSLAADSPRVLHHDFLPSRGGENFSGLRHVDSQTKLGGGENWSGLRLVDSQTKPGGGENWSGLRHVDSQTKLGGGDNWSGLRHVDSQTKLGRQPEQHAEYRMNAVGHSDHRHEIQHSWETFTPQGEHKRLGQQHKHSIPSQHQHYHHQHHHQRPSYHHHQQHPLQQQQQGWYTQADVDFGPTEQSHQDIHKQQQGVLLHHQPPHHLHHSVSMHDQCSWNAEYHARSVEHNAVTPFIHGSTQINPQILHGMAPAPPFQIGSAPSSPRVGMYDFQGKCSCGLQHSQVHRGITVSIGEQSHTRLPLQYDDQAVRKQRFWDSSRFYDNTSHTADSLPWQQAPLSIMIGEVEHREHGGSHWQQYQGRPVREFRATDSQTRTWTKQYCETLLNERDFQPTTLERPEMNKQCLCSNCLDNRRQLPMEMMVGQTAHSEMPDQASELGLHQKGFDSDGGRVSAARKHIQRVPSCTEEIQRIDFGDDRFVEGESGLFVSQLPGDSELRNAMATCADEVHHERKPGIPLRVLPRSFSAFDDPQVSQPLVQGPSDWHSSVRASAGVHGHWADQQLLSQQGQSLVRPMEASDISLRMSIASCTPVMMEEIANSTPFALVSNVQHLNSDENDAAGRAVSVAPVHCSAASGEESVDLNCTVSKSSAAHGVTHFLSPDVIPRGHHFSISVTGQAVPLPASITSNMQQATVSPIYDLSPLSSIDVADFSFAADKTKLPPPETNIDKKLFASCMSSTEIMVDGVASSVLDSCSHEEFSSESSVAAQDMAFIDSLKIPQDQAIASEMESLNTLGLSATKQGKGLSPKYSIGSGSLEAITEKEAGGIQGETGACMEQSSDVKKRSHEERDSEVAFPGMDPDSEDSKTPALSEAEAEAIARGLQIIKNSDLEDLKELGSGTYGTVFHGKWRGSDVAIKRIKASCFTGPPAERERLISDFWREACTLGQLHHPNVVAFYGIVPDGPGGTLATVTEFMVNGSLKQVLHKKDRTIDRRKRLFIAMDAAFGMEYLHSKNIVHFDLKCENLLVNMRDAHRPICKVGDFGLSKVKHQTLVSGGVRGTLPWMAPELLSGNNSLVSDKIDVFSFGIVMWELLTGEEPYANMHFGAIIGGIVNNTLRPSIPSWCDPGWRSLMERCWSGNPAERPVFAEVARELRAIAATMNLK